MRSPSWFRLVRGIVVAIAVLVSTSCGVTDRSLQSPVAVKGVLDLSALQLSDGGAARLDGEWEFYWQRLLTASDFGSDDLRPDLYVSVPGTWNGEEINGERLGPNGYATYRLVVNLGETGRRMALKFPEAATAATIFIDGKRLASSGVVGTTREAALPAYVPQLIGFEAEGPTVEVVLHVSNFHHRTGGARQSMSIGSASYLTARRDRQLFANAFIIGVMVVVGSIHLGLFLVRRERKTLLFFSVICLFIVLRSLTTSERFLLQLLPSIPWGLHYKLEYLSFFLVVPAFAHYLRSLFPGEYGRKATLAYLVIATVSSAIVVVFPVRIFSRVLIAYQLYTIVGLIYGLFALLRAARRRREGAIAIIIAFVLFAGVVLNDLLFAAHIIHSALLTPIGMFAFVILQSAFLSRQNSRAYETIDRQRVELSIHREGLEQLVEDRTRELETAKQAAERANMAKSDFLAHMNHELRTPLNHIHGFAQLLSDDRIGPLNATQREFLSDILGSGEHLLALIDRVLDLTKVEAGRIDIDSTEFLPVEIVSESVAMLRNRAQQTSVDFLVGSFESIPPIVGDRMMLKQVIFNILDNALKFSPDGGVVRIEASLADEGLRAVTITITDVGIGLDDKDFDRVFEPLEQIEHPRSGRYTGAGIGMALARRYVELHHGTLRVYSEGAGKGTTFAVTLPL
jgi:signal transduction histidine kinase